jgi:hypothetical protein
MHRRTVAAVTACLLAVSLSACAGLTGPGATEPPGSTTSTSTSPSPSPTPINTADPATWIVSDTGIGPFQLGANLAKVAATLPGLKPTNADCPNPLAAFFDGTDIGVAAIIDDAGSIVGVSVGNPLQTPDAATDSGRTPLGGPHTTQGLGYGSTPAELTAAYPSVARTDYIAGDGFPLYTVKTAAGAWITFSVRAASQTVNDIGVWPGSPPPYEYCG